MEPGKGTTAKVGGAQGGWDSQGVDSVSLESGKGLLPYTMHIQSGWGSKPVGPKVGGAQRMLTQLEMEPEKGTTGIHLADLNWVGLKVGGAQIRWTQLK